MKTFKIRSQPDPEFWAGKVARLVDEWAAYYGDWRADANAVTCAYQRWMAASASEETRSFAAYLAALDQEECAARSYELLMDELERLVPDDPPFSQHSAAS